MENVNEKTFNLKVELKETTKIKCYNPHNKESLYPLKKTHDGRFYFQLPPDFRCMLPLDLSEVDFNDKHILKVFSNSNMAEKFGVIVTGGVQYILDPNEITSICLVNTSDTPVMIFESDYIVTGRIEKNVAMSMIQKK